MIQNKTIITTRFNDFDDLILEHDTKVNAELKELTINAGDPKIQSHVICNKHVGLTLITTITYITFNS